jgi:hypothetical protein
LDQLPQNWQADKTAMIVLLHHVAPHGDADQLRLLARARLEQRDVEVVDRLILAPIASANARLLSMNREILASS